MFKSRAGKLFFIFSLVFASSCSYGSVKEENAPDQAISAVSETKSEVPFSTKEPDIYQVLTVSQIYSADEKIERKIFTARNGAKRLTVFNTGEKDEVSRLESETNQIFLVNPGKKVYAEMQSNSALAAKTENNDFFDTELLLNQKTEAAFENLGTENGLSKFRVLLGDAENPKSEILIFVDENLKIPARQEFYSLSGDQRILTFTVEMKDFKMQADDSLFELPKDFRKISSEAFRKLLWETLPGK